MSFLFRHPAPILAASLALSALPATAQDTEVPCELSTICLGMLACQDWQQTITITPPQDDAGDWSVDWAGERRAGYVLVAEIPAPEGSLRPTVVRTLVHTQADTQSVQIISFTALGDLTVTLHQPQATPPAVTAYGRCDIGPDAESGE